MEPVEQIAVVLDNSDCFVKMCSVFEDSALAGFHFEKIQHF